MTMPQVATPAAMTAALAATILRHAQDTGAFLAATTAGCTVEIVTFAEGETDEYPRVSWAQVRGNGAFVRVGLYLWDKHGDQSAVVIVGDHEDAARFVIHRYEPQTPWGSALDEIEGTFNEWTEATPRKIATWIRETIASIQWTE